MGGPGASVLLRHALTRQQEDELDVWLRSITRYLEQTRGGYTFWLNDNAFSGTVSRCPFYLSLEEVDAYWDDDEQQHLDPNSPLKAIWAEAEAQFGPVIPPELSTFARMPPLEEIHAYVTALPGTVYEIEYSAAAGHRCVSHLVDTTFFRAWMAHPHFRMIK